MDRATVKSDNAADSAQLKLWVFEAKRLGVNFRRSPRSSDCA
jgi:hypothetical protein